MVTDKAWQGRVKRLLKAELKMAGISYRELANRLEKLGISESETNIANKISRGGFSAAFFFECMAAIERRTVTVPVDQPAESQNR